MTGQAEIQVAKWKLYSPWIVLLMGLAVTIVTWRAIVAHEVQEIGWATQLAAEAIRTDLREDMEWQRIGLDRLALLWDGAQTEGSLWSTNALLYIEHRPGCVAVEWIAVNGQKRVVFSKVRTTPLLAFNGMPKAAMDLARDTRNSVFSTSDALGDGSVQWAVVHPVYASDRLRGYVISFFDAARSIDDNLADIRGLGFSFAVVFPTQNLEHALPEVNREYEQQWALTELVPLSGVKWQLRVWPNPSTMIRIRSLLPQLTLGVGTVLSLLAFLTFYFAARVARSSARVALTNNALQREIGVREGVEKELRRAHDGLEARVQQRTAELSAANAKLESKIAEHARAEESLQELTGRLFEAQDEERRRLARELHDGTTQNLLALALNMASLRKAFPGLRVEEKDLVSDSAQLIQKSIQELRTTSYLLHPPLIDELGLPATLRSYVDGFAARSGIRISFEITPELERLDPHVELGIFRMVQESLTNIHRHSHSPSASILLSRHNATVLLEIKDDGTGIPPEILSKAERGTAGVGIAGMRERVRLLGGHIEILSGSGGTTIRIVLPAETAHPAKEQMATAA